MKENRWGGASGPTSGSGKKSGWGSRARDWADDKTGRRMSTGWKAARGQKGFKNRRRAAGQAVKNSGGGGFIAGLVGLVAALFAGIASLFGRSSSDAEESPKAARYAKDGHKLGPGLPGHPGVHYADPDDTRPGYVDRAGLGPDHPGYTTGSYDANVDPRTWEERVAAGDVPGFNTNTTTGDTMTSNSHRLPHAASAAELNATVAKAAPEDLFAVIDQAREWPDFVQDNTLSIRRYVQQIQGNRIPLGPDSIQALQDFFALHGKLMEAAQAIHPVMTKEHADDLARREHTRGNENLSNV